MCLHLAFFQTRFRKCKEYLWKKIYTRLSQSADVCVCSELHKLYM